MHRGGAGWGAEVDHVCGGRRRGAEEVHAWRTSDHRCQGTEEEAAGAAPESRHGGGGERAEAEWPPVSGCGGGGRLATPGSGRRRRTHGLGGPSGGTR
jgi:hypothetical protein